MAKYKVVRTGSYYVNAVEAERYEREQLARVDADLVLSHATTEDDLVRELADADAVLKAHATLTARVLGAMKQCKVVVNCSTGYDQVDVDAATECGIPVANLPFLCVDEVAEHAIALTLACVRKISQYDRAMRQGVWDRLAGMPIHRLRGQTMGLLGFGNISRATSKLARAFGMEVLAYDPYVDHDALAKQYNVTFVDIDELLRRADVVSNHIPLNPRTRGLLDESKFRLMKPTAYFVTTSRGPVTDEAALIKALREGWIAGAGIDVFEREPTPPDNPLLAMDNVVATPHAAGTSEESADHGIHEPVKDVLRVLMGYLPKNLVNPAVKHIVALKEGDPLA